MDIAFDELTPSQRYFALVQTIIPRPIAWVLTENVAHEHTSNTKKSYNLAPFSFFTGICSDPALVMLSVGKKPSGDEAGKRKDTCVNIQMNSHFVIHIASTTDLQTVNDSSATLNYGESEVERLGLALASLDGFSMPRLKHCSVALGCELYRLDEIGNTPQAIIYGEVKSMYIHDSLVDHSKLPRLVLDPQALNPLARLGGNAYAGLGPLLVADRPD